MVFCFGTPKQINRFWHLQEGCCSNRCLKMWKHLWNWVMGRGWQSFEVHALNMDVKGRSDEISDRNEEHAIGNWKAILVVKIQCFVEGRTYEQRNCRHSTQISKQSVGGVAWALLTAYNKMQEVRGTSKDLLSKNKNKTPKP